MSTSLVNSPIDCACWKRRLLGVFAACWLTFAAPWAFAQTCSIPGNAGTLASAVSELNSYWPGTASPLAGATSIAVAAGAGFAPIAEGDLLLIIQMQAADLDTSNTNSYGDGTASPGVTSTVAFGVAGYAGGTTSPANLFAGTYEWAVATNAKPLAGAATINLSAPLQNAFFTRAAGVGVNKQAFQVIRVPQYANLTLNAGLTVRPWNGSIGGVVALDATGDLNLNGQTIDGTGRGFRGGRPLTETPTPPVPQAAAYRDASTTPL